MTEREKFVEVLYYLTNMRFQLKGLAVSLKDLNFIDEYNVLEGFAAELYDIKDTVEETYRGGANNDL